jgi:hypothetical protein
MAHIEFTANGVLMVALGFLTNELALALANKTARIAWKLMVSGERYDRARAANRPAALAA